MKHLVICLFILSFIMSKVGYAQTYSNFENVGQRAFSIIQNMQAMNEDQYVGIFSGTISMLLYTKQISSADVIEIKNELRKTFRQFQQEGRNLRINWERIEFLEFKKYPVEENGNVAMRLGLLSFKYNGKDYCRKVRTIMYEGRYYLLGL